MDPPAPQLEVRDSDCDRGLAEDSHAEIIYRDGVFYQEGIEGAEKAIIFDRLGVAPPPDNTAGAKRPSSRKRAALTSTAQAAGALATSTSGCQTKRSRQTWAQAGACPRRNP